MEHPVTQWSVGLGGILHMASPGWHFCVGAAVAGAGVSAVQEHIFDGQ